MGAVKADQITKTGTLTHQPTVIKLPRRSTAVGWGSGTMLVTGTGGAK